MIEVSEAFRGPWPWVRDLTEREVATYLVAAAEASRGGLLSRCDPWTVDDVTVHLAATFDRFAAMVEQTRRGDVTPPFAPAELAAENQRAIDAFKATDLAGDPCATLADAAARFLDLATDPDEPVAHQFGVIPMSLQMVFGLNDVVMHHDDIAHAADGSYRPPDDVVAALVTAFGPTLAPAAGDDDWSRIVRTNGR